jgi:hypothetical protein
VGTERVPSITIARTTTSTIWVLLGAMNRGHKGEPGFVMPVLATRVQKLPSGPEWEYKVKWDGYRILAVKSGSNVQLFSRRGTSFTDRFEPVTKAVAGIHAVTAILDGEVVATDAMASPANRVFAYPMQGCSACVCRGQRGAVAGLLVRSLCHCRSWFASESHATNGVRAILQPSREPCRSVWASTRPFPRAFGAENSGMAHHRRDAHDRQELGGPWLGLGEYGLR